jgi:hypothetical protein
VFRSDIQRRKTVGNPLGIDLFQKPRFNTVVEHMFALVSIVVLVGPIYLLNDLGNQNQYLQNTAVLACTAVFAFLMSSAASVKRHEVFAITSA